MSKQQRQTQVQGEAGQQDAPCLAQPFWAILVDSIATLDILDFLDSWFGHWWNRPFWKADRPLRVFLENLTWTGHVRFALPRVGEITGREVEVFLRNHGVYIWGRFFDCANVYFNVKKEQAAWAEYLLEREGITTVNAPVDPRNRVWAEPYDKAPPGWGSNRRSFGDLVDVVFGANVGMRYQSQVRKWPVVAASRSRRRARRKQQPTTLQRLTRAAGKRANRRRPRRPARPGQSRPK